MSDDGQIELASGTLAVVAPTKEGNVLVGFYARGIPGTARMTADEWDAFKAIGDRAFGREARKAYRLATVSDDTKARGIVASVLGLPTMYVSLRYGPGMLSSIGIDCGSSGDRGLSKPEVAALEAAGLRRGARGWEIEA